MNSVQRWLDKLSVYLPLMVMALLASGSWWLVRSVPELLSPVANKAVRQTPDYRLSGFSVKSFDATGRLKREVSGESAQHLPAAQTLMIEQIRLQAESHNGAQIHAHADQGIANDDGSQVFLIGNAYAKQQPNNSHTLIQLRGERLLALPDEDRILSSDPVLISRDRDVFTADTMNINSSTGEHTLQGRVRATLAAP
jgi:lipopolysaccharide export system protein LptC